MSLTAFEVSNIAIIACFICTTTATTLVITLRHVYDELKG